MASFAYTRPLRDLDTPKMPLIFRDFLDVFANGFPAACKELAKQLGIIKDDPAFLGYFICNEPT